LLLILPGFAVQLEEGELDYVRSQEYKYCMHKYESLKHLNVFVAFFGFELGLRCVRLMK